MSVLAVLAVIILVWGLVCYSQGYRDGRSDTRLGLSKPVRK